MVNKRMCENIPYPLNHYLPIIFESPVSRQRRLLIASIPEFSRSFIFIIQIGWINIYIFFQCTQRIGWMDGFEIFS
jgi:hypothetical protein